MKKRLPQKRERPPRQRKVDENVEKKLVELANKVRAEDCQVSYSAICEYMKSYLDLFKRTIRIVGYAPDDIEQECLIALRYKAIDDFKSHKGTFRTFAILCIKRHLSSIAKSNNQYNKRALNYSLSIDTNKNDQGEEVCLRNLIASNDPAVDEKVEQLEFDKQREDLLVSRLSEFEKQVYFLYRKKFHYDEIVQEMKKNGLKVSKKAIDNGVQRVKLKARLISKEQDIEDQEKK